MKKAVLFVFVVVLVALTLFAMLPEASAVDHCANCADTGDCFACCRCNGGGLVTCLRACGG